MISKEAKKFILNICLLLLYTNHSNASAECSYSYAREIYTEIGCKPIYGNGDSNKTCPVAYDCKHVFTRPRDKCYFNGNIYEPNTILSVTDVFLHPCLNGTTCIQEVSNSSSKTGEIVSETSFRLGGVQCPEMNFTALENKACYYEFVEGSCCELNLRCLKENKKVEECVYNNQTYTNSDIINIANNELCTCSPEFNGPAVGRSCNKIGCYYEINNIRSILNRDAPVWFKFLSGCPALWLNSEQNPVTNVTPPNPVLSNKSAEKCRYGNLSFSLGQNITIASNTDYWCSCEIPPLITCIFLNTSFE